MFLSTDGGCLPAVTLLNIAIRDAIEEEEEGEEEPGPDVVGVGDCTFPTFLLPLSTAKCVCLVLELVDCTEPITFSDFKVCGWLLLENAPGSEKSCLLAGAADGLELDR